MSSIKTGFFAFRIVLLTLFFFVLFCDCGIFLFSFRAGSVTAVIDWAFGEFPLFAYLHDFFLISFSQVDWDNSKTDVFLAD